jgi:transcriptional regulator
MYIPKHFNQPDKIEAISFIERNSFGQLISMVEGHLFTSHLPFLISSDGSAMLCHMARQNPQWETIEGQEILVTFQGPHDYISPGWYTSPGVPTWNYQVAHVYGICRVIHSAEELAAIVERLTQNQESRYQKPWTPEYSESMLKGIVGLEVSVTEIQCKFKLNQNRSAKDRSGVIGALEEQGSGELASAMKKSHSEQR